MKKSLIITTFLASSLMISSCATMSLVESTRAESPKQYEKTVLADSVIAVGYPSAPIENHEHAMLLAGKKYSFLVEPIVSFNTPKDLFKTLFAEVDLNALYIDPSPTYSNAEVKTQAKSNVLTIKVQSDDSKQVIKTPVDVGLLFAKPIKKLKVNEQKQIEKLGFECKAVNIKEQENLICQRVVHTAITVASAVQNIDNVDYKLKQPLTIVLEHQGMTEGSNREWLRVLTPVTIAVDIVTLPVQAIGAGLLYAVFAAAYSNASF